MVDLLKENEKSICKINAHKDDELKDTLLLSEDIDFNNKQPGTVCTKQVINIRQ